MRNSEWIRTLPSRDLRYLFKDMYCTCPVSGRCEYKPKGDCAHCGAEFMDSYEENGDICNSEYIRMMPVSEMGNELTFSEGLGCNPICQRWPCEKRDIYECRECARLWLEKEHEPSDEFILA